MTDIRALAESFVEEEISHFGGAVPIRTKGSRLYETQVTNLVRDRAELARAVLRLLEAGERMEQTLMLIGDGNHAINMWRAAVRGEEGG